MKKNKKTENIVLVLAALFCIGFLTIGIYSGCVIPKGGEQYCLVSSPRMYYLILLIYGGLGIASLFQLTKNMLKKK